MVPRMSVVMVDVPGVVIITERRVWSLVSVYMVVTVSILSSSCSKQLNRPLLLSDCTAPTRDRTVSGEEARR